VKRQKYCIGLYCPPGAIHAAGWVILFALFVPELLRMFFPLKTPPAMNEKERRCHSTAARFFSGVQRIIVRRLPQIGFIA